MELLNISFTLSEVGTAALDAIVGRDVSFLRYPGPAFMELERAAAACSPSYNTRPELIVSQEMQALMALPRLLRGMAARVQDHIDADPKLAPAQVALFS